MSDAQIFEAIDEAALQALAVRLAPAARTGADLILPKAVGSREALDPTYV